MKPDLIGIAEHLVKWNVVFDTHPTRLHDQLPQLPLSPLRWDLKTSKQGGWLPEDVASQIASALAALAQDQQIRSDWIIGIPNSGTEHARLIAQVLTPRPYQLILTKEQLRKENGTIRLALEMSRHNKGVCAILADDVIGAGLTKLNWIRALLNTDIKPVALLVVIDREEGGTRMIQEHFQIPVLSLFKSGELLRFGVKIGAVQDSSAREAQAFHKLVRELNGLVRANNGVLART